MFKFSSHYEVSALSSRVDWTSAHNNERTNERMFVVEFCEFYVAQSRAAC